MELPSYNDYLSKVTSEGEAILEWFKKTLNTIRTSRPTAGLVEDIKVEYYNQLIPLKSLGTINVHPPREIEIQVWDKNAVAQVAKAIESSDLHLTCNTTGNVIRIFLPELSVERKEELKRYAKKIAEECRIKIRQLRDTLNKKVQEDFDEGILSEDLKFKIKEEIQKKIDQFNEKIEELLDAKIAEIEE